MTARKPSWGWKARDCVEIAEVFDYPFAIKEFVQNQVGQILKEKQVREWSDWNREDLRGQTLAKRMAWKKQLATKYPGLMTGPHGAPLRNNNNWLPIYTLTGAVPFHQLKATPYKSDLQICTVLWEHKLSNAKGFSFFNNHLDQNARFTSFVVDGESTSRTNDWAIGEKGKGFMLATQYLREQIDCWEHKEGGSLQEKMYGHGISFRVGHQIGELDWKKCNYEGGPDQLRVALDDLTPVDLNAYMKQRDMAEGDGDDLPVKRGRQASTKAAYKADLHRMYERRFQQGLARNKDPYNRAAEPSDEDCLVAADEVCITILGTNPDLTVEVAFSGIYGIVPPEQEWRIEGHPFTFFKSNDDQVYFYLRDQKMLHGPELGTLSINYHGDMRVTGDRCSTRDRGIFFDEYKRALGAAAHAAFIFNADLARELAYDILSSKCAGEGSIARTLLSAVKPGSEDAYSTAFKAAWKKIDLTGLRHKDPWPYTEFSKDLRLIEELDMTGRQVPDHVMRLLVASGAYKPIEQHMETLLLKAPLYTETLPGLDRFKHGVQILTDSDISPGAIFVHNYSYSNPKVVWAVDEEMLVLGIPEACDEHEDGECLCWIGPYLGAVWDQWTDKELGEPKGKGSQIVYRAFFECMKGVDTMDAQVAEWGPSDEGESCYSDESATAESDEEGIDSYISTKRQLRLATKKIEALFNEQEARNADATDRLNAAHAEELGKLKTSTGRVKREAAQAPTPNPTPAKKSRSR